MSVSSGLWEALRLESLDALTQIEQRRGKSIEEFDDELRQRLSSVEGGRHHRGRSEFEALVIGALRARTEKRGHPLPVSRELVQKLLGIIHGPHRDTGEVSA